VELVDDLGYRHELGHRAEGLAAKIGVGPCQDDPPPAARERGHEGDDPLVEKLRFVDGNYVRRRIDLLPDLEGRVGWNRLNGATVMTGDRVNARIPLVQVRLEDLDALARDDRAAYATYELLALAAKHHAGNDFDPSTALVEGSARPAH
jgi:hypothetical protein